jgi:hypothetical protein
LVGEVRKFSQVSDFKDEVEVVGEVGFDYDFPILANHVLSIKPEGDMKISAVFLEHFCTFQSILLFSNVRYIGDQKSSKRESTPDSKDLVSCEDIAYRRSTQESL